MFLSMGGKWSKKFIFEIDLFYSVCRCEAKDSDVGEKLSHSCECFSFS